MQFLDDTVAGIALALVRNMSDEGSCAAPIVSNSAKPATRGLKAVVLLGDKIESVTMEPFRMLH